MDENSSDHRPPSNFVPDAVESPKPEAILDIAQRALIEARLAGAESRLRDSNQESLARLNYEKMKPWWRVTGFLVVIILGELIIYQIDIKDIPNQVKQYVQEKVAEPAMKADLQQAASKEADAYAKQVFRPLQDQATGLSKRIEAVNTDISKREVDLAREQKAVAAEVRAVELSVSAKGGNADAFAELKKLASESGQVGQNADLFATDVARFYDGDRYNLVQRIIRDPISQERPILAMEGALEDLQTVSPPSQREADANMLMQLGLKSAVGPMVDALRKEKDLLVISRITAALVQLTNEYFDPIQRSDVYAWWEKHKGEPQYNFSFKKFEQVRSDFWPVMTGRTADFSVAFDIKSARKCKPVLRELIEQEPKAAWSRCCLIFALITLGEIKDARTELDAAEKQIGSYWYMPVIRSAVLISEGKSDETVPGLNQFFSQLPTYSTGSGIKQFALFKPLAERKDIKWPAP